MSAPRRGVRRARAVEAARSGTPVRWSLREADLGLDEADVLARLRRPASVALTLSSDPVACADCEDLTGTQIETVLDGQGSVGAWMFTVLGTECARHDTVRTSLLLPSGRRVDVTVRHEDGATPPPASGATVGFGGEDALFHTCRVIRHAGMHGFSIPTRVIRAAERCLTLAGAVTGDEALWRWAHAGFTDPVVVHLALEVGMDPRVAQGWMPLFNSFLGQRYEQMPAAVKERTCVLWWQAAEDGDFAAGVALAWLRVGVWVPGDRPVGLGPVDVQVLREAGVRGRETGWAGIGNVCPDLVAAGVQSGASPAETVALFTALAPRDWDAQRSRCSHADLDCGWGPLPKERAVQFAGLLDGGLDWADAAACLRAGMSTEEALSHLRSGSDMEPVRLVAALT